MRLNQKYENILHNVKMFKNVDIEKLISYVNNDPDIYLREYKKGEVVFHIDDEARVIGIVLTGKVAVEKILANGQVTTISRKISGELIGEAAVFSNMKRYPCDLIAVEDATILMIPKASFINILYLDKCILSLFLEEIATMTYMLQNKVELLSFSSISSKLAFYILSRRRQCLTNEIEIDFTMTKLAEMLNVSRPSMHREMKKLEDAGYIKCINCKDEKSRSTKFKIIILDESGLIKML